MTVSKPVSNQPSANQQFADIVVRGIGKIARGTLEKRTVIAPYNPANARKRDDQDKRDGRAIITSLVLYGASKIAARSTAGVVLVAGGFVLKALYDRGKAREQAQLQEETGSK